MDKIKIAIVGNGDRASVYGGYVKDERDDAEIVAAIKELEKQFEGQGRVLIRTSGTEPLVRVMIEGKDKDFITKQAVKMAQLVEKKLK